MGVFLTVAADTYYAGGDEYGATSMAPPHRIGRMDVVICHAASPHNPIPANKRKNPSDLSSALGSITVDYVY